MKLLFELSGENPTLPCAEIECVAAVTDSRPQVAVAECSYPQEARRLAMTHIVLEYLGECAPDISSFKHLLSDLSLTTDKPFAGWAKMVHEGCQEENPCSQREFERLIGTMISGPVRLINPVVDTVQSFLRIDVISAGSCIGSIEGDTTAATRAGANSSIPGS